VSLQSQLLQLAPHDRGVGDVLGQGISASGATQFTEIGEAESDSSREDALILASRIFTGSGRGFATGPSQHVITFWRQSRQR
jgi:hypothetical protein